MLESSGGKGFPFVRDNELLSNHVVWHKNLAFGFVLVTIIAIFCELGVRAFLRYSGRVETQKNDAPPVV